MKKIICVLLAIILVVTMPFAVSATSASKETESTFSLSAEFNSEDTFQVIANVQEEVQAYSNRRGSHDLIMNLYEGQNLSFDLSNASYSKNNANVFEYTANGSIDIAEGSFAYSAEGRLLKKQLDSTKLGIIGNLIGSTNNGIHVNITVHAVPSENKFFAFVSTGYVSNTTNATFYIFGKPFDEMNVLTDDYVGMQTDVDTVDLPENFHPEVIVEPFSTRAVDDYNTHFRSMVVGRKATPTGELVDLAACTLYTPNRIKAGLDYKIGVKLNGSLTNGRYYFGSELVPGVISVWHTDGMVEMKATSNSMEIEDLDPGDESWEVTLNIPFEGSIFDWFPLSFNIGINTIKTTRTKNAGSSDYNQAKWDHNYTKTVNWVNSDPVSTADGYCGRAEITFFDALDTNYTTYIVANSTLQYSYSSQVGVTSYSGGVTVYANGAQASIIVDKFSE